MLTSLHPNPRNPQVGGMMRSIIDRLGAIGYLCFMYGIILANKPLPVRLQPETLAWYDLLWICFVITMVMFFGFRAGVEHQKEKKNDIS